MNELFFRYLVQNNSACIQGVGTIQAAQSAIRTDITNHLLHPAGIGWLFTARPDCKADAGFINYIARYKNISDAEAGSLYQDFATGIANNLQAGNAVTLYKVGELAKGPGDAIVFTAYKSSGYLQPVPATRIIRKNEVHSMIVGANERTNTEMAQLLNDAPARRRYHWWIAAAIIAAGALALIAIHFSKTSSAGNRQPVPVHQS